ncbi:MAG: hypothetical protein RL885_17875 [Planctomycetota bacterium]
MKWQIPRLATILLLGLSSNLFAQYGAYGHDVATSSEQAQSIALAVSFLQNVGGENLAGIQISNADLEGSLPAASSRDGKHIGIDFAPVGEVIPPSTPGAPGHPGLVVMLIFHELQHLHHGWGDSFCQEVELTVHVSSYHCDFIRAIRSQGGGPLDALCKMYDHVRSKVNAANIRARVRDEGCSGNTGPIGACPECDC